MKTREEVKNKIINLCIKKDIKNISLVLAFAKAESDFYPYANRFESGWRYFTNMNNHPIPKDKNLELTRQHARIVLGELEYTMQSTSHGIFQVMGSTGKWLGHTGNLFELYNTEVNLALFKTYYDYLSNRYDGYINDIISAYNQGNTRKNLDGRYKNYEYVNKVIKFRNEYEKEL